MQRTGGNERKFSKYSNPHEEQSNRSKRIKPPHSPVKKLILPGYLSLRVYLCGSLPRPYGRECKRHYTVCCRQRSPPSFQASPLFRAFRANYLILSLARQREQTEQNRLGQVSRDAESCQGAFRESATNPKPYNLLMRKIFCLHFGYRV